MKIKVCGMRQPDNISALVNLAPDYIGFIFFEGSKRFAGQLAPGDLAGIPSSIKKIGVFVDAAEEEIGQKISEYQLDGVQLHGAETPQFCRKIKETGVEVIKAFGIDPDFDFNSLNEYEEAADYFLFDTKTSSHGGSGKAFDWEVLNHYQLEKPYFLSGGLSPENLPEVKTITDNRLFAVDLNSKFESEPGLKDMGRIHKAIELIRE